MLSALKRLTGKTENGIIPGSTPGHYAMSHNLQRKFAKGVQYNMKIIIKGDRNTGKTCLFNRLQGKKFIEEYTQTNEIQVASIQWSYKAADDVVKVEVWDVVDKGKKRIPIEGLKLGSTPEQAPALDAEFLDVYKGTNGIILTMDITKSWTFDYIQRELPKVPEHIPVLVLGNHCDMSHHRTVTVDHVLYYIESIQRPKSSAQIRYTESSMSNGFGLKYIHKFFCLPFLQLQRETLLGLLERNKMEAEITVHELDIYQESEDADYDRFLEHLTNKRRQMAESHGQMAMATSHSIHNLPPAAGAVDPASKARSLSMPDVKQAATAMSPQTASVTVAPSPIPRPTTNPITLSTSGQPIVMDPAVPAVANTGSGSGIMAKIFGKKDGNEDKTGQPASVLDGVLDMSVKSVEEFIPDGGELDNSFLEDTSNQLSPGTVSALRHAEQVESDSDVETGNPLVQGFQDDLDPEDVNICTERIRALPLPTAQPTRPPSPPLIQEKVEDVKITVSTDDALDVQVKITEDVLDEWMGMGGSSPTGRVSPEGGEDSGPGGVESSDSTAHLHSKKSSKVDEKSKSKHHKKKSSKEKSNKEKDEKSNKEEKRNKKKRSSNRNNARSGGSDGGHDELEDFLNSHDNSYEVI